MRERQAHAGRRSSPRSSSIRTRTSTCCSSTLTADQPRCVCARAIASRRLSATHRAGARVLPHADVATVERGALLHDLGKLAMPEAVLRKPAPLTVEEQRLIRTASRASVTSSSSTSPYLAACRRRRPRRARARRRAGISTRQPGRRGLRSAPASSAVADAYDTMTRARVFRDAITAAAALAELDAVQRHAVRSACRRRPGRASSTRLEPSSVGASSPIDFPPRLSVRSLPLADRKAPNRCGLWAHIPRARTSARGTRRAQERVYTRSAWHRRTRPRASNFMASRTSHACTGTSACRRSTRRRCGGARR